MGEHGLEQGFEIVGQNVVAICDIDEGRLAKAGDKFPKAKRYTDWRKLLEQSDIDAVTISTPDHTHAPATMTAISARVAPQRAHRTSSGTATTASSGELTASTPWSP